MALDNPAIPLQESWQAPTLLNSWVNFGGAFNPVGYWRDSFGVVHLRGNVKTGVIGSTIFNLPSGYRPANTEGLVTFRSTAMGVEVGRVDIASTGSVLCTVSVAPNGTVVGFMFLDGLTFRAV